jgi:hypothetical protein
MRLNSSDEAMHSITSAFGMAQIFVLLILMSGFNGPTLSIYTAALMNATDTLHTMDIEVDMFSAAPLYLLTSFATCVFALTTKRMAPNADTPYCMESITEASPWEFGFWCTVICHHATMILFMCAPVDWYFLSLTVCGITLVLLLLARLPFLEGATQSRSNFLMLVCGALYFTLYTAVRRHGHMGFLAAMVVMDSLILIGHTFDANPNMQTISNSRLVYNAGSSVLLLISFFK